MVEAQRVGSFNGANETSSKKDHVMHLVDGPVYWEFLPRGVAITAIVIVDN